MTIVCKLLSEEFVSLDNCIRIEPGVKTRNVSGKEKNVLKDLSQWLVTSDCFHLRLGNLRGNEDFTGDWISRRKKHGPKVQLLVLTIEKLPPVLWGEDHILQSPKGEKTPEQREREEKIKSQRTVSLDFCTF